MALATHTTLRTVRLDFEPIAFRPNDVGTIDASPSTLLSIVQLTLQRIKLANVPPTVETEFERKEEETGTGPVIDEMGRRKKKGQVRDASTSFPRLVHPIRDLNSRHHFKVARVSGQK